MKLISINQYRDGGSYGIVTDEGEFWIDFSIHTQTPGEVYVGNINDKSPMLAINFKRNEVIRLLCDSLNKLK